MKKLAATLTLGAVLAGACTAGGETATAPPYVPEATARDAVSADVVPADDSMSDASPVTMEGDDERDLVDLTAAQAPDPEAVARCQAVVDELERREEADLITDEADGEELSEEEIERFQHTAPDIDGGVLGAERPTFPEMPRQVDLATADQAELFHAVDLCFESGVLVEDEDEGSDEEDMAAFCAELASLSADEVAEWAADEGDEVVDEEFGWCELQRPDRQ